jgi:hypothetical protein
MSGRRTVESPRGSFSNGHGGRNGSSSEGSRTVDGAAVTVLAGASGAMCDIIADL